MWLDWVASLGSRQQELAPFEKREETNGEGAHLTWDIAGMDVDQLGMD